MAKIAKRMTRNSQNLEPCKFYALGEAVKLVKSAPTPNLTRRSKSP